VTARGPFRAGFWRSPLRGRWLTAVLGLVLLLGIPLVAITGLLSNVAYQPHLGGNVAGTDVGRLDFAPFAWPTGPSWLYAFTQGAHVTIGLSLLPVLMAKLWSVLPRLFEWPPARSPAHALERLSLVLLVGSVMFEFTTGIVDIQLWTPFGFYFPAAHYYGAWVFMAAFAVHAALKLPAMRRGLGLRRALSPTGPAATGPAPAAGPSAAAGEHRAPRPLESADPLPVTFSRRALLGTVGAGSLLLALQGAGEAVGGALRPLGFLAPRVRMGTGPNGFPVNRPAATALITSAQVGAGWRLELAGARRVTLTLAQLRAMDQHTYDLPIGCVEGWSTTQRWTGVRLRDLAALAGVPEAAVVHSVSVSPEPNQFNEAWLDGAQIADDRSLLALRVNGAVLSRDHGYPARVIGPAVPGVHCTKWVGRMEFTPA
jgi:DMSO/TMAO reductase YedYZ molybdopterin-dependent catalytic subunit